VGEPLGAVLGLVFEASPTRPGAHLAGEELGPVDEAARGAAPPPGLAARLLKPLGKPPRVEPQLILFLFFLIFLLLPGVFFLFLFLVATARIRVVGSKQC
jgi:hypothetical protein